jgi:hypothetical protein
MKGQGQMDIGMTTTANDLHGYRAVRSCADR